MRKRFFGIMKNKRGIKCGNFLAIGMDESWEKSEGIVPRLFVSY